MTKAAAVIGIIAGFLSLIAAVITLVFGGAASAFGTSGAGTVVNLGWGGVLFSLAALIASALIHPRPRAAGGALILIALLGAVLGGTLVAICMILALIAGLLAITNGKGPHRAATDQPCASLAEIDAPPAKRGSAIPWMLGAAVAVIGALAMMSGSKPSAEVTTPPQAAATIHSNPAEELASLPASDLQPTGELAAVFELGGDHTDVQRENTLQAIRGKVVIWELPVYDVKRDGENYRVTTESHLEGLFDAAPIVGTRLMISPRNDEERRHIESLKTGQMIRIKGQIQGVSLRHIAIMPAIPWPATEAAKPSAQPVRELPSISDLNTISQHYLMDCKRDVTEQAIQLGGMDPCRGEPARQR